ncbi:MAG: erythromycin esterase family protein [Verrucomicrobiaceae bacterium]|nr:erythromycin esterase family protein [Verrucomicrobiaceae bacterium]
MTSSTQAAHASAVIRSAAHPLRQGETGDYTPLLDFIGEARFVLLGESSHGTHEFYRERAQITKRLITERGFNAVAVEADFPDAQRVNHFVRNVGGDLQAVDSLAGFRRFPAWMWRNADVLDFVGWLRAHNDHVRDPNAKTGFYGLDLYSLHTSMNAVLDYLDKVDPTAAKRARERYSCFNCFGGDAQRYGLEVAMGHGSSCEDEVVSQFVELFSRSAELARLNGRVAADDFFNAEQNARLVKNAEQYYRTMYRSDVSSWNLRDSHMTETLFELEAHLSTLYRQVPKIVVWEHNSHIGDARATDMNRRGEWNLGQLVRQSRGDASVLVGFTTAYGSVTASCDWGGDAGRKRVRPPLRGSIEAVFHHTGIPRFLLLLREDKRVRSVLHEPLLERAIGVIYRPETERSSHYFHSRLADQFDAVIHIDETRAVEPLERSSLWEAGEAPETFPSGV